MEILVCVKQVPDDSVEIKFNEKTGTPILDGVTPIVNAFDGYALEMATRYKEANGGTITALSIGTEKATDALKNCLAVGADKAFLVSDESFNDSDTLATSYILSKAIAKIEETTGTKFDIIFCGLEATDYSSRQVGAQLAQLLEIGQVTAVLAVDPENKGISVKQETEEGYRMIEASVPCVLTITKPDYDPRYPTMRNKMAARKVDVPVFTAADLGTDASKVGANGSFVKVVRNFAPAKKEAGVKIQEESGEECAAKAVTMMAEAKVI
jgi:Electron transfer flavoprotein, beta subunit